MVMALASATNGHVPAAEDGAGECDAGAIELAAPSTGAPPPPRPPAEFSIDDAEELLGRAARLLSAAAAPPVVALVLAPWTAFLYRFLGRLWGAWPPVLIAQLRLWSSSRVLGASLAAIDFEDSSRRENKWMMACCSCAGDVLDFVLCGVVSPLALYLLTESIFRDVDGTINFDWLGHVLFLGYVVLLGFVIAFLKLGGTAAYYVRYARLKKWRRRNETVYHMTLQEEQVNAEESPWHPVYTKSYLQTRQESLHKVLRCFNAATLMLNILCVISVWSHFGPYPEFSLVPDGRCNPVDSTLCALPFPSDFHMKEDSATASGWKVDLKGLPPLRGGIPLQPTFLNDLDGFSTMAPILFYMEGLKEAHEREEGMTAKGSFGSSRLQGLEHIEHSVTNQSITLLVDVDDQVLIPHSAEIDYLDPDRPLCMVTPAQPLKHATNYALAVVNARDVKGNRLPQSQAMKDMLRAPSRDGNVRNERFADSLAALAQAAGWTDFDSDPESLQLLFSFITISQECQIGHMRAVRDATLEYVAKWNWEEHVESVSEKKHDCGTQGDALIARTVHINLDVPSFLESRSRYSTLDIASLSTGGPVSIGKAKVMIRIPCSVEQAALGDDGGKPVKAIMEYGHGLFNHRGEVTDSFLSRMANDNGYILMSMDWRGMSRFDMPVVIRTLIGNPNLFQSIRDNLIQGFSEKLALQHFARNGMLEWLTLEGVEIPTENDEHPASVFYGISQGGILGGGYLALAAKTNLIDRGILGSPGTTFASVMTRSLDFKAYDVLMITNLYNNREVRLLLTMIQMGWDSVEASGLLAPLVDEPLTSPILIQTGLGDAVVSTNACESMVRAMHGSTLPNNPRSIYGVHVKEPGGGPGAVLTELMYEREYKSLPEDNTFASGNSVHYCVRNDPALINQIEQFTNTGRIIDPCAKDQCKRKSSRC